MDNGQGKEIIHYIWNITDKNKNNYYSSADAESETYYIVIKTNHWYH